VRGEDVRELSINCGDALDGFGALHRRRVDATTL